MIDYAAILGELEDQEQLDQAALAKTRAGIAAIRPLARDGKKVTPKKVVPHATKAAPPGKPQKHYGRVTPEQWEQAEAWWRAGESAVSIGRRLSITDASVHYHAKAYDWPKRPRKIGAVAAASTGVALGGRVTCPACHLKTDRDPCEQCGKPVRKSLNG